MTRILSPLSVEYLDNSNRAFLAKPFGFISDVLISHGLRQVGWELRPPGHEDEFWAPFGFVFDFESVPNLLRGPLGENKRGGATHDPICRKNVLVGRELTPDELALLNDPNTSKEDVIKITLRAKGKMTKSIAADVYQEIMHYCNDIDEERFAKGNHPYLPNPIIIPYVKSRDWLRRWMKSSVVRVWPGYFQKYELTATALEIYGIEGDPYVTTEKLDAAIVESKETTAAIKAVPDQVVEKSAMVEASEKVTDALKDAKADVKDKI